MQCEKTVQPILKLNPTQGEAWDPLMALRPAPILKCHP